MCSFVNINRVTERERERESYWKEHKLYRNLFIKFCFISDFKSRRTVSNQTFQMQFSPVGYFYNYYNTNIT